MGLSVVMVWLTSTRIQPGGHGQMGGSVCGYTQEILKYIKLKKIKHSSCFTRAYAENIKNTLDTNRKERER